MSIETFSTIPCIEAKFYYKFLVLAPPQERHHFQFLCTIILSCRVLIIYSAIAKVNNALRHLGPHWFLHVRIRGRGSNQQSILQPWSKDAFRTSQATIMAFLRILSSSTTATTSVTSPTLVSTIPDRVFDLLGFCASFLIGCKLAISKAIGLDIGGLDVPLLVRTKTILEEQLQSGGFTEDGDGGGIRCARLIGKLVVAWERRERREGQRDDMAFVCGQPSYGHPEPIRDRERASSQRVEVVTGNRETTHYPNSTSTQAHITEQHQHPQWFRSLPTFQSSQDTSQEYQSIQEHYDHPPNFFTIPPTPNSESTYNPLSTAPTVAFGEDLAIAGVESTPSASDILDGSTNFDFELQDMSMQYDFWSQFL